MSVHWSPQGDLRMRTVAGPAASESDRDRAVMLRNIEVNGSPSTAIIRAVSSRRQIKAACGLVNDRYEWRGYGGNHEITADAYHVTFNAELDGEVVGTITLGVDSRAGLSLDRTFGSELRDFRAGRGSRLCELTKFAFSPSVQSRHLMAALFHVVFIYGQRTYNCTDLLIEVNPRHVRFYEMMLHFEKVGALRSNESVGAPAQLMRIEVETIRREINRLADPARASAQCRSLYPFFLSPSCESEIYARLVGGSQLERVPEAQNMSGLCEHDWFARLLTSIGGNLRQTPATA